MLWCITKEKVKAPLRKFSARALCPHDNSPETLCVLETMGFSKLRGACLDTLGEFVRGPHLGDMQF